MKRIKLPVPTKEQFDAITVLKTVVGTPVGGGVNIADMRKRLRIEDALEIAVGKAQLLLEDQDHAALVAILNGFPFGVVHRDIDRIVAAVESAETYRANADATETTETLPN